MKPIRKNPYKLPKIFGMIKWYYDQKKLVDAGKVELVGGAQYA